MDWNGHLYSCGDLDFCGSLVHSLSNGSLEPLGLDDGGGRSDSSGRDDMRDVKEVGGKVLRFYDFLIKVFDAAL